MVSLPYDNCELNNEYLIDKLNESSIVANMIFCIAIIIMYILFTGVSAGESYYINAIQNYKILLRSINNDYEIFDFNRTHDIKNPYALIQYYNTLDFNHDSDTEVEVEPAEPIFQMKLRSKSKSKESSIYDYSDDYGYEYGFDRDYNIPLKQNTNLDIKGSNWKLD
jgi:hypothetical protein